MRVIKNPSNHAFPGFAESAIFFFLTSFLATANQTESSGKFYFYYFFLISFNLFYFFSKLYDLCVTEDAEKQLLTAN